MSIYRFADTSAVCEVTFRHASDHPPSALLSAADDADTDQLSTIRRAIESQGWNCVPVQVEDKTVLQVNGFKEEGQLAAFLQIHSFTQGAPNITREAGDHPTRTIKKWLKDTSLRASGWSYVIGDTALLMSGLMGRHMAEATAGALYTPGGIILARYGNVNNEHFAREISERTAEFLKDQAGDLPEDCGLYTIMKQRKEGVLPDLQRFLSRFPVEVTTGIYTMGSAALLQSGLKNRSHKDTISGATSTVLGMSTLMIPEKRSWKKQDANGGQPPSVGDQVWDWVREKPLRLIGYAYLISGVAIGLGAYREHRKNPAERAYIFKFITAASYLVGDLMLSMSHKDHVNASGKFDADEQRRIEALAAETIARQPLDMREPLADHVAGFLATQPEMNGTSTEISEAIMKQVASMEKNRWSARATAVAEMPMQQGRV